MKDQWYYFFTSSSSDGVWNITAQEVISQESITWTDLLSDITYENWNDRVYLDQGTLYLRNLSIKSWTSKKLSDAINSLNITSVYVDSSVDFLSKSTKDDMFLGLFSGCNKLQGITFLATSSQSKITFEKFFSGCSSLETVSLGEYSGIISLASMFKDCTHLSRISMGKLSVDGSQDTDGTWYGAMNYMF